MKKKLLFSILCLVLLLPIGVKAEGAQSQTATVGNVDVPTYSISMSWGDLTFDWVYDSDSNSFGWKPGDHCVHNFVYSQEELDKYKDRVYTDADCSKPVTEEFNAEIGSYWVLLEREEADIVIIDGSTNGKIVPSIVWEPEEKYNETNAEFKYIAQSCELINSQKVFDLAKEKAIYSDANCTSQLETVHEYETGKYYTYAYKKNNLTTEEIPESGRTKISRNNMPEEEPCADGLCFYPYHESDDERYFVSLKLVDGSTTPTPEDTIGTITVKIKAAE